jgi:hypothetical protein
VSSQDRVTRKQAEAVVEEIKRQFPAEQGWDHDQIHLRDHTHEGLPKGRWSVDWEGQGYVCPEDWAVKFTTSVPGVGVEPIMSFVLLIYPN